MRDQFSPVLVETKIMAVGLQLGITVLLVYMYLLLMFVHEIDYTVIVYHLLV